MWYPKDNDVFLLLEGGVHDFHLVVFWVPLLSLGAYFTCWGPRAGTAPRGPRGSGRGLQAEAWPSGPQDVMNIRKELFPVYIYIYPGLLG